MDKVERFNLVAYGGLLALYSAFASAGAVLVHALESRDIQELRASGLIFEALIEAVQRIPAYGETIDFRTQILQTLNDHRQYTDAAASGDTNRRAAIVRDIEEGQTVLGVAFARLGQRLGISE